MHPTPRGEAEHADGHHGHLHCAQRCTAGQLIVSTTSDTNLLLGLQRFLYLTKKVLLGFILCHQCFRLLSNISRHPLTEIQGDQVICSKKYKNCFVYCAARNTVQRFLLNFLGSLWVKGHKIREIGLGFNIGLMKQTRSKKNNNNNNSIWAQYAVNITSLNLVKSVLEQPIRNPVFLIL